MKYWPIPEDITHSNSVRQWCGSETINFGSGSYLTGHYEFGSGSFFLGHYGSGSDFRVVSNRDPDPICMFLVRFSEDFRFNVIMYKIKLITSKNFTYWVWNGVPYLLFAVFLFKKPWSLMIVSDPDQDPTCQVITDPDPGPTCHVITDPDPDPTCHFISDPDPDR